MSLLLEHLQWLYRGPFLIGLFYLNLIFLYPYPPSIYSGRRTIIPLDDHMNI